MIFIKEHFDKILEAYDKDYKKMDDAWSNQRDPNNFSKHISSIEPKIPSLQIPSDALKSFGNKVTYKLYTGQIHGFLSNSLHFPKAAECIKEIGKAVKSMAFDERN